MNLETAFPDCLTHLCEQRSDEWFDARKGYLTASQFGAWLAKAGKTAESARATAMCRVLAEAAGYPDPPPFENEDMRWGTAWEPTARKVFEQVTGHEVTEVGFCQSRDGLFGCSPDGLITNYQAGLEIKCPRASKVLRWHLDGVLPTEYRDQVLGSMAVTGAKSWHFFGYHPALPPFHIVAERDVMVYDMRDGLIEFSLELEKFRHYMSRLQSHYQEKTNQTNQ